MSVDGKALQDIDPFELRQIIYSVDGSLIVECSIREYLQLSAPSADTDTMLNVLNDLGLWSVISHLPDRLETQLSALGAPLQGIELLMLKLASAILCQPKILVLNQRFDHLPSRARERVMRVLEAQPFTVLYFSGQIDDQFFDETLTLAATSAAEVETGGNAHA